MGKVRKFEDGLILSIRGKIVGLLLQDIDLVVKTVVTPRPEGVYSTCDCRGAYVH